MLNNKKGKLIVISAPSGTGKTTICKEIIKRVKNIKYSVSTTTRPIRKGEIDGKDYFFVTTEEFKNLIKRDFFVEWEKVYNHYYGTSKKFINDTISRGINCLLDIDVKGSKVLMDKYPDGIFIFLIPPSLDELRRRLLMRNTENKDALELRLKKVKEEMEYKKYYKYIIMNDKIKDTVNKIVEIINKNV